MHTIEQEEVMAYLDGELPVERAAVAAAHLEGCEECRELAADFRAVSQRMLGWEVEAAGPRVEQSVVAALDRRGRTWREVLGVRRVSPWVWGLAGAVGVVLVVSWLPRRLERGAPQAARRAAQSVPLEAALPQPAAPARRGSAPAIPKGPMLVRTARLALTAREFDKARAGLDEVLKRHRGHVGNLNVTAPGEGGRVLEAVLRVPADQLEAVMAELKKLGRVESESQTGEEVTQQYVDLEARLSNARNTEQRLIELLRQRTGKLGDLLSVEEAIGRVRGEIERMEAEKKNLANRVEFATLQVRLAEDYKAQLQLTPDSTNSRFRNAAVEGYKSMVEGVIGVTLFLLSYGPTFLIWGGLLFSRPTALGGDGGARIKSAGNVSRTTLADCGDTRVCVEIYCRDAEIWASHPKSSVPSLLLRGGGAKAERDGGGE